MLNAVPKEQPTEEMIMDLIPAPRKPYDRTHKIERCTEPKHHLLLILTGSVSLSEVPQLIHELYAKCGENRIIIKIVATKAAILICEKLGIRFAETMYYDEDELSMLDKPEDPLLHIELRDWADSALIAPLDANTLAKMNLNICDNLATSVICSWNKEKPMIVAPSIHKFMWRSPLTVQHRIFMKSKLGCKEICPIHLDGYSESGLMAPATTIASHIESLVKNQFAYRVAF